MAVFTHYPCVPLAAKYHLLLLQVLSLNLVPWGGILQTPLCLIQSPSWSAGIEYSMGFEIGIEGAEHCSFCYFQASAIY